MHPAALDPELLLNQCMTRRGRTSGPGGQHRNKVETAVLLHHNPTGVEGRASERRQQSANHGVALFRLRVELALTQRGYFDLGEVPSVLWRSRCGGGGRGRGRGRGGGGGGVGRLSVSSTHGDFPAILAEALDVISEVGFDVKQASGLLGCSATQLVKLLRQDRRALVWVNQEREKGGMGDLR